MSATQPDLQQRLQRRPVFEVGSVLVEQLFRGVYERCFYQIAGAVLDQVRDGLGRHLEMKLKSPMVRTETTPSRGLPGRGLVVKWPVESRPIRMTGPAEIDYVGDFVL